MEIIQKMIAPQDYFPGNPHYPLLIYRKVFANTQASLSSNHSPQSIQIQLAQIIGAILGLIVFMIFITTIAIPMKY